MRHNTEWMIVKNDTDRYRSGAPILNQVKGYLQTSQLRYG